MKLKIAVKIALVSLVFVLYSCNKIQKRITSPDGKLKAEIMEINDQLFFTVSFNDSLILEQSPLGIKLQNKAYDFTSKLKIKRSETSLIHDTLILSSGKQKKSFHSCNELLLVVVNNNGENMSLVFRAYNDGIAFRYVLTNDKKDIVEDEISGFKIPGGSIAWAMESRIDNEGFYPKQKIDTMKASIYAMPFLVQTPFNKFLLLHEADVMSKYCASSLKGNSGDNIFKINIRYPKFKHTNDNYKETYELILENENTDIVAAPDFISPWRVLIIGETLKPIVESTLVEALCPKPVKADLSWIQPGVSAFPWWGNNYANGDTVALKEYIDMASAMNWTFVEFDVSLIGSPSYAIDKWKTTPWVKRIVDYAVSKGVSVYGWDERRNLNTPEKRADIFDRYRDLGIKGIKIDFINSINQEAMAFREACLSDALKYNLLVSFHGDYPPRGERRTYPNLMTQEGIKGSEYYIFNWQPPTPEHNCAISFTRNVIGPMDYTPVAFSTPNRTTTYAHELALSVVVESGWLVMCDKPEMYLNSPARAFLSKLVSAWDETKFLGGYPGEYFLVARRHNNDWFIAGINAGNERTIEIKTDFLKKDQTVKLYCDGNDAFNSCEVKDAVISTSRPLSVTMAKNGGFAIHVSEY